MSIRIFFIFYLLSFSCTLLAQQNPQLHFINYGTEDGLPSPEVHCVLEDSRSHMWFGTDNGAARFDGYKFETFGRKEGLNNPVVFNIFEDKKGRIWLSTMSGNIYIWEEGKISPWKYNHLTQEFAMSVHKGSLQHLSENETAYLEFSNYGFVIIDKEGKLDTITGGKAINKLALKTQEKNKAVYGEIYKGYWQNTTLLAEKNYLRKDWDFETIDNTRKNQYKLPKFGDGRFSFYVTNINSNFLVFGYNGVNYIEDDKLSWSSPFPLHVTHIFHQENEGGIWICLNYDQGLRLYENIDKLKKGKEYKQYLKGESVSAMIADTKGGYWITTLKSGVFYVKNPQVLLYNRDTGLSDNYVTSIAFKDTNVLYAGFQNSFINEINQKQNTTKALPKISSDFQEQSLYYDTQQDKLYSRGYTFNNNNWEHAWCQNLTGFIIPYLSTSSSISFVTPKKIYFNSAGGINILDKKSKFVVEFTLQDSIRRTFDVIVDFKNRMWVGTNTGLQQFIDHFLPPPNSHPSFHTRVEAIEQLSDSTIVFGTKGLGVTFWKEDSVINLTTDDGLTSDMIENIYIDEKETIWVGTLAGLNKIIRKKDGTFNIRQFNTHTGLPSNEIHEVKSNEGQIWICTSKGLVKFHEHEEEKIAKSPILQKIQVNDILFSTDTINRFSHDQNNLRFQWLTINFRQNGKIPYRYRLNAEAEWNYIQNLNTQYPSLSPGNYVFEIQSQNEDRYWSESTTYEFSIKQSWWSTWWFRGLSLLALSFGIYFFYQSRLQRIVKENGVQKQMADLEKSALQAQMNPHFIFNCLNSIQNFILQNDAKKAVEYLSRFARLVRHNLNASVNGRIYLEEEVSLLENYLALEKERFNEGFDYQINISEELRSQLITIPPLLIQPYVENAIIHGLSDKKSEGKVEIVFRKNAEFLVVQIKDNGKGYQFEKNPKKQVRNKSVGMSITRERLRLLNSEDDNVEINSSNSFLNKEQGTTVTIKLKIDKS